MRPDDYKGHFINPEDLKTEDEAEIFFRPSMFIDEVDESDTDDTGVIGEARSKAEDFRNTVIQERSKFEKLKPNRNVTASDRDR